jgi:bacterioferritin-associated ferredoxin
MAPMFVCSCRAVTDRTIGAAVASGASSIEEVALRCGAGNRCRGCWPQLQRLIDDHDARVERTHIAVA